MNAFYWERNHTTTEIYKIGVEVPFEDDYVGSKESARGYTLRVDDFRIVDSAEFIGEQGFTLSEEYGFPEKLALVYLTLRNIDSTDPGITLPDLTLSGIDQNARVDWELLPLLNPVLENGCGIALVAVACHDGRILEKVSDEIYTVVNGVVRKRIAGSTQ